MARSVPPIASIRSRYSTAPRSMESVRFSMVSLPPTGSTVLARPLSAARICCVRSARRAESSVGSDSASSRELVCSDWAPPRTAAIACSDVRITLTSGCCAVKVEPVPHQFSVQAARGAEFGDLLEEIVMGVEEEGNARRERVDLEACRQGRLDVGNRIGEGERHLLDGARARFPD